MVLFSYHFAVTTCPKRCNFRIDYLYGHCNSLREIDLTIGNWNKSFNPCLGPQDSIQLNINCSTWNASKSLN